MRARLRTFLFAAVLLAPTPALAGDLYGNPIESWRCGKVVVKINKYASTTFEWEFSGRLPKRRMKLTREDHAFIDLNGEPCEKIKPKEEEK
jgi:hypothetical protein